MRYKPLFVLVLALGSSFVTAGEPSATQPATTVEALSERIDALAAENRALREEVERLRAATVTPWPAFEADALEYQLTKIGASVRKAYEADEGKTWSNSKVTVGWPRVDVERSNSLLYPVKGTICYSESVKDDHTRQVCIVTLVIGLRENRWTCISANRHTEEVDFGITPQPSASVNGDQDVTTDFEKWVNQAVQGMLAEAAKGEAHP